MTDIECGDAAPTDRPPPIRVLLLLTSTAGGVGLHAYYLAKYLPESDFDVTVAFGPGYPLDEDIAALGVRVEHFHISRRISPLVNLRGLFEVLRFLRRNPFDILCIECSIAGLIGRVAGWIARVPVRIFVIQLYASHPRQSRVKQFLYRMIERALDPLTTRYVAVSETTRRFGVDRGIMRPEKVEVIYNSVALPDTSKYCSKEIRAELGLRPDSRVVGTLSRLDPQKGLDDWLKAAALVRERLDDVEFIIAGEGQLRQRLLDLSSELGLDGCVKFLGWRSDVPEVLSSMDVYCQASLWEALPFALAEAMAMNRPVVATSVDGVPEVVVDGETGILVPPRDPSSLADALLMLLRDPALQRRMGVAGRRWVEDKFCVEGMIRQYARLFTDLVRPARDSR